MASYDFFLAHAGPDASRAEQLYDLLSGKARVFLDSRSVSLGDDWDRTIAQAQRASRVTVVLVSASTDAAFYEREEIAAAIDLARKNDAGHRVVPVYLGTDPPADLPYGLRLKVGLKVSARVPLEKVADRLLDLHRTLADGRTRSAAKSSPPPERDQLQAPPVATVLRTLRMMLAELISDEDEAKRIVRDSDAPVGGSWWSKDPEQFWQRALGDAHRAGRMEFLFAEIDRILADNRDWRQAKLAYFSARETASSTYRDGIRTKNPEETGLALSEQRMNDLADALGQIKPWAFRDSRIAHRKITAAKAALSSIDPFVKAWGAAAAQETRQPAASDLQELEHGLRVAQQDVALKISALEWVRSEQEARQPCTELAGKAAELLKACRHASHYVI